MISDNLEPEKQVENLREAFSLLSSVPAPGHHLFMDMLAGTFDLHNDVDPFLFLDLAANGSALEMLTLLNIDVGDFTKLVLEAAESVYDEHHGPEETEAEEWDSSNNARD